MPSGRFFPPPLSMYVRLAGCGRNIRPLSCRIRASRFCSRLFSNIWMLWRSTPAAPRFFFTARKASCINSMVMRPVNEWCLIGRGLVPFIACTLLSVLPERVSRASRGERCLAVARRVARGAAQDLRRSFLAVLTVLMIRMDVGSSFRFSLSWRWMPFVRHRSATPGLLLSPGQTRSGRPGLTPSHRLAVSALPYGPPYLG